MTLTGEEHLLRRRRLLGTGTGLLAWLAAACGEAAPSGAPPAGSGPPAAPTARVEPTVTPVPTPVPTPTPIPEPRHYAVDGGYYYAETGFAVRDEPGGPRMWTELARLGGVEALGLPTSRAFDIQVEGRDARVQVFQKGWLVGAPAAPAVRRGEGQAPAAPAEALAREERPEMAFVGRVDVEPRKARQGQAVLLRVWSATAPAANVTIENRTLELVREGDALVGLFGVHRQGRPGPRPVRFTIADAAGRRTVRSDPADTIEVVDGGFDREELIVDQKALALLDPVKQAQENAVLDRIQAQFTPQRLWRGPFVEPVGNPIVGPVPLTSDFGILRSINGGPYNWSHEGTDFEVDTGDPIRAVASGRVVSTQELYVRGNTVVIDHGIGVFSMYNHLFRWDVQVGQDVKAGDAIGLVGSTGFVTGPHLHLEIRIHNVPVEPLEWLGRSPFERPDLAAL